MCLFKLPFLYSLPFLSYFFLMSYMKHFVFCCWKVLEKYNTNILKLKPNVKLSKHSFSLILSLPKIRLALGIGSHFIKLLLFWGGWHFFEEIFCMWCFTRLSTCMTCPPRVIQIKICTYFEKVTHGFVSLRFVQFINNASIHPSSGPWTGLCSVAGLWSPDHSRSKQNKWKINESKIDNTHPVWLFWHFRAEDSPTLLGTIAH